MTAAIASVPQPFGAPKPPPTVTLLSLVAALSASGASDREVEATVMGLLETGRVRLIGQVCDEDLLEHRTPAFRSDKPGGYVS